MSRQAQDIRRVEAALQREEKNFLMEQYSLRLLPIVEVEVSGDSDALDGQVLEALLAARPCVGDALARRIDDILRSCGRDIDALIQASTPSSEEEKLFVADDSQSKEESEASGGEESEADVLFGEVDSGQERGGELFAEEEVEAGEESLVEAAGGAGREESEASGGEESEAAGVLFSEDIYSGNKGVRKEDAGEVDSGPDGADAVEQTPGFEPVEGHRVEQTPGFEPVEGHRVEQTPGFEVPEASKGKPSRPAAVKKRGRRKNQEREKEEVQHTSRKKHSKTPLELAEERRKKLEEQAAQQAQEEAEDIEEELDLEMLSYVLSLEDLEQYMGIQVLPDDRMRLERRWKQKTRDASLKRLLTDVQAMKHPYALIPRLSRYIKDGKPVVVNMISLLRTFPQHFDNVAQIINKYRPQPFFTETPTLDWVTVACEALPEALNRNYMEQRSVLKQYALHFHTNELRVSRRNLVDALYDVLVINAVMKEHILSSSVDLTESKIGRQNFVCINFGRNGIRIGDLSRQQRHPQMGVCPSW